MNKNFYVLKTLLVGLCVSQIISWFQVYLSNIRLCDTLTTIKAHGYLLVPNQNIISSLKDFYPAFMGGLFFTITLGSSISIITFAAVWAWDRLFLRKKSFLIFFLIIWALIIVHVNISGFSFFITSYFLFIPLAVCTGTLKWMPVQMQNQNRLKRIILRFIPFLFIPLLLFPFLSGIQAHSNVFLHFRDNILLSNHLGIKLNDFYYKYGLYPAQVFKSLNQKTLKTYTVEGMKKQSVKTGTEKKLLHYDYLNVGKASDPDLTIKKQKHILLFKHKNKTICTVNIKEFLANPGKALNDFSHKTDKFRYFRMYIYFSLITAPFIILYIILYNLLRCLIFFISQKNASEYASVLCFLIVIFFLFFSYTANIQLNTHDIEKGLGSENQNIRIKTLKYITKKKLELINYPGYRNIISSPHMLDRTYLAIALGVSREQASYDDLLLLLNDSEHIVVWTALGALGRRQDKGAVNHIINLLQKSDHWYEQWYAYNALKNLGWRQKAWSKKTAFSGKSEN
jgi:hypothetical protein